MKKLLILILIILLSGCTTKPTETPEYIQIHFTNDYYRFNPKMVQMAKGKSIKAFYYEPELPGYQFIEWRTIDGAMIDENTIFNETSWLFPVFEEKSYLVTFVTNGGTPIEPLMLPHYPMFTFPEHFTTKDGYEFIGWFYDADLTQGVEYKKLVEDITIYAKWNPIVYTLTYYISEKTQIVEYFQAGDMMIPYDPYYPVDFIGWVEADSDILFDFSNMPQRDVVVYMKTESNQN